MMHVPEWGRLLDIEPVNLVLSAALPGGYLAAGGGGDFVLGGTSTYQSLHLDVGDGPIYDLGVPPAIGVNFVIDDMTCTDAPLRLVPGSQHVQEAPPTLPAEPRNMKDAVICPLPAGSAIVRDLRAWHGGTPNGADRTRYLPNAEFVSAPWGSLMCGTGAVLDPCQPVLPRSAHERMSPHGRAVTANIVDQSGELEGLAERGEWLIKDFVSWHRHSAEAY